MHSEKSKQFIERLNPDTYPKLSLKSRVKLQTELANYLPTVSKDEAKLLIQAKERAIDATVEQFYKNYTE